jgi:ribosomal protein L6P/L9E
LGTIIKHKNKISLALKENRLYILDLDSNEKKYFYLTLLRTLIIGVSKGYRQKLKLVGVGYKAFIKDKNLIETYKAGSNYIKSVQKEMNLDQSSLLVNNNSNDLDTSDEEVNKLFCLNSSNNSSINFI